MDPLYKARRLREAAAQIIRHCKSADGSAYLRDEPYFENAGAMLARRGFGRISPAITAGRGNVFMLVIRHATA